MHCAYIHVMYRYAYMLYMSPLVCIPLLDYWYINTVKIHIKFIKMVQYINTH